MKYLLLFLLILVVAGFVFFPRFKKSDSQSNLSPQENSEGEVTVEATPIVSEKTWQFKIVLNTHSVELDQDLTKVVILQDDQNRIYQPNSWEGAAPGGHHREGVLSFTPVSPKPKSISLIVKDIGTIAARNFRWELGEK